jgi:hypothetical protein
MKPGDVIKIRGGTFIAADETTERGAHACTGCVGRGDHRKALCSVLPHGCSFDVIIWVAHDDPATTIAIAEFELEST